MLAIHARRNPPGVIADVAYSVCSTSFPTSFPPFSRPSFLPSFLPPSVPHRWDCPYGLDETLTATPHTRRRQRRQRRQRRRCRRCRPLPVLGPRPAVERGPSPRGLVFNDDLVSTPSRPLSRSSLDSRDVSSSLPGLSRPKKDAITPSPRGQYVAYARAYAQRHPRPESVLSHRCRIQL
jgi:hypothetical protein